MTALTELAAHCGILDSYVPLTGGAPRVTPDETREAILAAMGFDVSSDAAAQRALEELRGWEATAEIDPVRVVRQGAHHVAVRATGREEYVLQMDDENYNRIEREGVVTPDANGIATIELPPDLPHGYYGLRLYIRCREFVQRLIVTPASCPVPDQRAFGIIANLYSLRGARDFGVGSFGDLATLAEWSARQGAAFVGVNPLHALRNAGNDISPYRPLSRIYRNPLYLDIEAIPEFAESHDARARLAKPWRQAELAALRESDRVEYERIAALQRPILESLYGTFEARHLGRDTERGRAYERYVEQEGLPLERFARHRALEEHFSAKQGARVTWRDWHRDVHDPQSPHVGIFAGVRAHVVRFHQWIQFELDRQLALAAQRGADAGLSIGLYQDLAIGCADDGADVWANQDLFLDGVSLGAPPDDYAADGQNWGIPPMDPRRLRQRRYDYFITVIRAALRHSGALRVDHVLGLFRQFWIPRGMAGSRGAYVRFPVHDLLGILALESTRQRALIVGEDLGTVPPEVPGTLKSWGVLSSRVMLFQHEADGAFRPAASYEPLSLTTADTHDMAPLEGWWRGRDLELREQLGLFENSAAAAAARTARARERTGLAERLAAEGVIPAVEAVQQGGEPLRTGVHRFLRRTPALLVGLSLDDLTGEVEPVNVPGVSPERFPSWTRRMKTPLDSLGDITTADATG
jgi:4-alpha-glucanotransferase